MNKQIMVFTWIDDTGMKPTGRLVQRNGVLVPEFERSPKAKAVVWSSDAADFERGKAYAAKEGYQSLILPAETKDVLNVARQMALNP